MDKRRLRRIAAAAITEGEARADPVRAFKIAFAAACAAFEASRSAAE